MYFGKDLWVISGSWFDLLVVVERVVFRSRKWILIGLQWSQVGFAGVVLNYWFLASFEVCLCKLGFWVGLRRLTIWSFIEWIRRVLEWKLCFSELKNSSLALTPLGLSLAIRAVSWSISWSLSCQLLFIGAIHDSLDIVHTKSWVSHCNKIYTSILNKLSKLFITITLCLLLKPNAPVRKTHLAIKFTPQSWIPVSITITKAPKLASTKNTSSKLNTSKPTPTSTSEITNSTSMQTKKFKSTTDSILLGPEFS